MKLVDVTCPKCRSIMQIDKKNKEAKCEFCRHKFIIDNESINITHIRNGEITTEQEYKNAETHLNKFKNYDKALQLYTKLSEKYADNAEIWLSILRCISMDFTNKEYDIRYNEYWKRFTSLAEQKDIDKWENKYNKYINSFNEYEKNEKEKESKRKTKEKKDNIYITMFGGMFGIHKFAEGKIGMGILYLLTLGLYLIGWIIDIIKEVSNHPNAKQKFYNGLGIYAILCGLATTETNFISGLLMISSGILCFKKITMMIWKKPVSYSKYIKIGLFVLGLLMSN